MKIIGKMSFFGGRGDEGMKHGENLSLYWSHSQCDARPDLFNPRSNDLTEGTSKRLNPLALYVAIRFDSEQKEALRNATFTIRNPANGKFLDGVSLVDWGPNVRTGREVDVSPAIGRLLDLCTDDLVEVERVG